MQLKQLYDGLMSSHARDLSLAASDAKKAMFDHLVLKRDLDKKKIRNWLGTVNDFLAYWCGYAADLTDAMKTTKGMAGIYCLPYADIKDYIYTKYDLPSVLKFADAVIKGINDKEFQKTDDIKMLFVDHVNRAFPGRADDVGGLLSEVLQSEGRPSSRPTDKNDAKLFDTAKKYKWYAATDRSTIYKAIETTCTYMTEKYGLQKQLSTNDLKLYVSVINMTVEYMVYTLLAYATRVYMISIYVWPHYTTISYNGKTNSEYHESTQWDENITTAHDMDDMLMRDPNQLPKLGEKVIEFLKMIGASRNQLPGEDLTKYYRYLSDEKIKDNPFYKELYDNELLAFLRTRSYEVPSQGRVSEVKHRLESLCLSPLHGLSTETTPKQAMLHAIRGMKPDAETQEGYRKLAASAATFGLNTLAMISDNLRDYERWLTDLREDLYEGLTTRNNADTCKKLSLDLYHEVAGAMMARLRDIEMRYNELSGTTLNDINKQLEIKIPGMKSDRSLDDNMTTAVPVSTRIPLDVIQLYASPVFDEASMILDILATRPGLQDYWYVTEAATNPVDALITFFQSIWRRIQTFFAGNSFKNAKAWVEKNEGILKEMTFENIKLSSLKPYKSTITVTEHYNNLIKNLQAFNPGQIKSQDDVDKFITSLYENENVAEWFQNTQDQETGKAKWRNYFLFQDLEAVSEEAVKLITLQTDEDIRKRMSNAIRDIKQSDEWLRQLTTLNNQIGAGMNHLKSSTVNMKVMKESVYTEAEATPTMDGAGEEESKGEKSKAEIKNDPSGSQQQTIQTTANGNSQQQDNGNSQLMKSVFNGTQLVLNNIWLSATTMIIEYVMDQYRTITQLFDITTKQQNTAAQQSNQQQEQSDHGGSEGNS